MPDATFATPDVTTFCRLDELGLVVVGQHLQPDRAVLACRVADDAVEEADRWCRRCGCEGRPRDTVTRRLAHEPLGWRPTTLLLTIRRYRCTGCGHVWRQDTSRAAEPRSKPVARATARHVAGGSGSRRDPAGDRRIRTPTTTTLIAKSHFRLYSHSEEAMRAHHRMNPLSNSIVRWAG